MQPGTQPRARRRGRLRQSPAQRPIPLGASTTAVLTAGQRTRLDPKVPERGLARDPCAAPQSLPADALAGGQAEDAHAGKGGRVPFFKDADPEEHRLNWTEIFQDYLRVFEDVLAEFIDKEGGNYSDFYQECREKQSSGSAQERVS